MIIWNLRKIMDERRIKGKDLAERVGKHPNTIYRLRDAEEMPSVDGKLLNDLCNVLNCTLADLIEFIPDETKPDTKKVSEVNLSSSDLPPTAAMAAAVAVGATQALGSTDPSLAAKVAASVMQILLEAETGK